ncbi:unnamed protein product [Urochloa humidicola]
MTRRHPAVRPGRTATAPLPLSNLGHARGHAGVRHGTVVVGGAGPAAARMPASFAPVAAWRAASARLRTAVADVPRGLQLQRKEEGSSNRPSRGSAAAPHCFSAHRRIGDMEICLLPVAEERERQRVVLQKGGAAAGKEERGGSRLGDGRRCPARRSATLHATSHLVEDSQGRPRRHPALNLGAVDPGLARPTPDPWAALAVARLPPTP